MLDNQKIGGICCDAWDLKFHCKGCLGVFNVELRPDARVIPQVKYGRPLEDAEPLLNRPVFRENMIIDPIEISRNDES